MVSKKGIKITRFFLIVLILALIGIQALRVASRSKISSLFANRQFITATVSGNVARPGTYRIPRGTSQFELLKVAGVRPTSNLAPLFLYREVAEDEEVAVGTLDAPVALTHPVALMRLEFFFGELTILNKDGKDKPQQEGTLIETGDRIKTELKSQAEVSIGSFSRVSIDAFSDVTFDQISEKLNDKSVSSLFQSEGSAWYQFVLSDKSEVFAVGTDRISATVSGAGADFMVEIQKDITKVHVFDGLLLADRAGGGEPLNLIAGQTLTVFSDDRPFQVSRSSSEVSTGERFSQLANAKDEYLTNRMPLNFLFMGIPIAFYLVNVQFEDGEVQVIHLPAQTSVSQFAQGFATLNEAYLHGEAIMVTTLVEQIMNARIPHYAVVTREGLAKTASIIGDISVVVDDQAAGAMQTKRGKQKLGGSELAQFLNPSTPNSSDRQRQVLRAIFEAFRSRNMVMTALSADQIVESIETSFTGEEIMKQYGKFTMKSTWQYTEKKLPTRTFLKEGKSFEEPDLEKARAMLFKEE